MVRLTPEFPRFVAARVSVNTIERRRHPRFPFRADVDIEWGASILRAHTGDIGSEGMFIETHDPLWVGATFSAAVQIDPALRVDCAVRRVVPGRGMGVSFVSMNDGLRSRIADLLRSLHR